MELRCRMNEHMNMCNKENNTRYQLGPQQRVGTRSLIKSSYVGGVFRPFMAAADRDCNFEASDKSLCCGIFYGDGATLYYGLRCLQFPTSCVGSKPYIYYDFFITLIIITFSFAKARSKGSNLHEEVVLWNNREGEN